MSRQNNPRHHSTRRHPLPEAGGPTRHAGQASATKAPVPLGALAAGFGLSLLGSSTLAQTMPPAAPPAAASAALAASAPVEGIAPAAAASTTSPDSTPGGSPLPEVVVKSRSEPKPSAKTSYQAVTSTIGKGKQALRDIPQSVTVVTEKLLTDRHIDTVKEALHSTSGITFLAAEGGEEDIRLRGFSLQSTGDVFADGLRDPAFYDRDTFNLDRLEVLRGSASMLFGRGSTGGAVNQVNKSPYLQTASEVKLTGGNHKYGRLTGDFNIRTGDDAALRINAMHTEAENNGAGSSIDKRGMAAAYRFGIGKADEFNVALYHLENNNGMNYGMPWIKPRATDPQSAQTINNQMDPAAYYGMASDYNAGKAQHLTLSHQHRFAGGAEWKSTVRKGAYERDQRAGTVRFAGTTVPNNSPNTLTNPATVDLSNFNSATIINRGTQLKIQDMENLIVQSDFTGKFDGLGVKHDVTTGVDMIQEKRTVYNSTSSTTTGPLVKRQTTVGAGDGGTWIDESLRVLARANQFESTSLGAYAQDMMQLNRSWKVLGGLRYDYMLGKYDTYDTATGLRSGNYQQGISEWSKRVGVLFQPNPLHSYHLSYGTSFNTSGDTYSYSSESANTDPESSQNIELGAKLDSADGLFSTRLALFHSTKLNERNQDPDTAATQLLLSGQRHTAGFEIDFNGKLFDKLETYVSYTWMPIARVDKAASPRTSNSATAQGGNRVGDRPGLTPKHSGTVWNTVQFTPHIRAGLGLNFRSKQAPADIGTPANGIWYAPGYATVDLMGEYVFNKQYALKANLNNAGNKLYADSLYRGHYIPGAGRIFQVTLTAKF